MVMFEIWDYSSGVPMSGVALTSFLQPVVMAKNTCFACCSEEERPQPYNYQWHARKLARCSNGAYSIGSMFGERRSGPQRALLIG
jgi:hypothetical protein